MTSLIRPYALCRIFQWTTLQAVLFGWARVLSRSDIKQVYCQILVNPQDQPLLGMHWQGSVLVDAVLPFGLRSAPLIFSVVADALEWIVHRRRVDHIFHYIDDFVVLGTPHSKECYLGLLTLTQTRSMLGCPIALEKTEGPATTLTVLGIEFNMLAMEMRLPAEKLQCVRVLLGSLQGKCCCQQRELEFLVGFLQHASKVVWPGRIFLRRAYDLLMQTQSFWSHFFVHLSSVCQADLEWWATFVSLWNGVSLLRASGIGSPRPGVDVWSDASGGWGCRVLWQGQWFRVAWGSLPIAGAGIAPRELFPIIVASMVWGRLWH